MKKSDYSKYRGKCKKECEKSILLDSSLTLVRGHYIDPEWGQQQHWWTVKPDGKVFDPTARQFPSNGAGEYIPFNGECTCENCGRIFHETDDGAQFFGTHALCSYACYGSFVL